MEEKEDEAREAQEALPEKEGNNIAGSSGCPRTVGFHFIQPQEA